MGQGKHFISILLSLVFLAGIIAPVPECYVTGVVCPLKKSIARAIAGFENAPHLSLSSPCCSKLKNPVTAETSKCPLTALKSRMRPYAPAFETVEAPVLPFSLLPVLFFKPVSRNAAMFIVDDGKRQDMPDPIPILLRKQSFLI